MKNKIFDIHTDIIYDVYKKALEKDYHRFSELHANQLNNSIIKAGVWTLFSPDDFNLLDAYKLALANIDFNLVKDFKVILGLEGLRNLKDLNEFKALYDLGVRHAMLTWNEENKYATGVFGSSDKGVSKLGYEVLDFMIEKDMIIDISHLNDVSINDVLNYTSKNIIASHSNVRSLCHHVRNLTRDQLNKLKSINALVGVTTVSKFISEDLNERNLKGFMNHINETVKIMGIDNVCLGLDFMDYFYENNTSNLNDLPDATYAYKLIDSLIGEGYSEEDIKKITYDNFYNRFKHHIINK